MGATICAACHENRVETLAELVDDVPRCHNCEARLCCDCADANVFGGLCESCYYDELEEDEKHDYEVFDEED